MSTTDQLDFGPVANDSVWRVTRTLFIVALLFFLVNIGLGFLNALTTGPIDHWQMLTHLHAAALGWFTLSDLGIAFWVFTGDRDVQRPPSPESSSSRAWRSSQSSRTWPVSHSRVPNVGTC